MQSHPKIRAGQLYSIIVADAAMSI